MSRPLVANPKRQSEAQRFHREVVKAHGSECYFCGKRPPRVDAMHVIPRSMLGKHRYACPEENGRPGCRGCHDKQTNGELEFSLRDRIAAVKALNKVLRVKLLIPTRSRKRSA